MWSSQLWDRWLANTQGLSSGLSNISTPPTSSFSQPDCYKEKSNYSSAWNFLMPLQLIPSSLATYSAMVCPLSSSNPPPFPNLHFYCPPSLSPAATGLFNHPEVQKAYLGLRPFALAALSFGEVLFRNQNDWLPHLLHWLLYFKDFLALSTLHSP